MACALSPRVVVKRFPHSVRIVPELQFYDVKRAIAVMGEFMREAFNVYDSLEIKKERFLRAASFFLILPVSLGSSPVWRTSGYNKRANSYNKRKNIILGFLSMFNVQSKAIGGLT